MIKILLTILFTAIIPFTVYAQQDTPLKDVKAAEIDELNQKEDERNEQIANLLGFVLPDYTDNPSYVITFTDPSTEQKGVEIGLDGKDYAKISSPYTFPALSIGKHQVKFRFFDNTDTIKILEYELIVIPRAPIVNPPTVGETSIKVTGTALANSDVLFTLTANAFNYKDTVKADGDGNWEAEITPEEGISDAIYSFTAYSRKYGIASELSDTVTFSVGESTKNVQDNNGDISFSFSKINKENIINVFKTNTDLILLIVAGFFLGVLLTNIFRNIVDGGKTEKKIKEVEKLISKKDDSKSDKDTKTLRELFGGEQSKEVVEEKKEESLKEEIQPTKEQTIINKDVFLRKYKDLDPDKDDGKEIKKKIKVSLTSKEE
ncbi:MAG TPA: hypothetical protein PKH06_02485 [Candidatus Dojkabacteria bacterium]|nr:hypothetical protein [Candidatus Dojkabacteria bacterium]